jgi:UDP-N-acetyl-2-amino-2-deoxyglucuronate dehydrogenase
VSQGPDGVSGKLRIRRIETLLKFALVGCGRIAKRHAELLGGGVIEGATLAAVCDVNLDRAQKLAADHGVPAFGSMDEMMTAAKPDVVTVVTESGNHADHVVALAPYGAHIIVEKPMALTLPDADRMIDACRHHKVKLFVMKQNRFNVPVVALKQALDAGRFGKLIMGTVRVRWCRPQSYYDQDSWRGTWALDGGVLANQASHHVDLLEWLMGDVQSVFAKGTTALAKIEAEDTAVAILKFKSGALGVIEATTATRPKDLEGSISILGEKGSVEIGGFAVNKMKAWAFESPEPIDADIFEKYSVNPPDVYGFGHHAYYNDAVSRIVNNMPPPVDGLMGRKSLELINAIYESIETGTEIHLPFTPANSRLGSRDGR